MKRNIYILVIILIAISIVIYLDTLACAYAEKGDFNKAIELEKEAYNLSTNIYYKEIMDIFENKLTYLDWKEKNPDLEKKLKNIH